MSFLAPFLLALGAFAGVPLLLHLMRRRLGARMDFPAVRYLARAEQEHSRRLRLRNLALMLLRVLLILLVALAAARPVARVAGAGHPPTALAVVLDNSMSTGVVVDGAPVLSTLGELAVAVLGRASADDRLWLVTADGEARGGSAADLEAAVAAVAAMGPAGGAGDLPGAVGRAGALVGAAGLPASQVVVLTDGQATAWERSVEAGRAPVAAYLHPGEPPRNHSIPLAEARPPSFAPRGTVVLRVAGGDSIPFAVELGGHTVARGIAGDGAEVRTRATATGQGWVAGSVSIPPDELRGDDVRYFAALVGPPPAVRVDASAGAFVPPAIDALVEAEVVARGADVVVASADVADRLPALLVAPADPARLGAANRNLERLGVPWRFGQPRRGNMGLDDERLEGASVALLYPLTPVAGAIADTLVLAGGALWAAAGDGYVILASPLDPSATTLPVRAAFVPWLGELLAQRLNEDPMVLRAAAPGARVSLPPWVTGWLPDSTGTPESIVDGEVTAPTDPGVYFLLRGPARAGAMVVNPEPEESELQRLSSATLRSRLGGRGTTVASTPDALLRAAFDPTAGRSLIAPLLAAALVALAAEGWLSRRGGGSGGHD